MLYTLNFEHTKCLWVRDVIEIKQTKTKKSSNLYIILSLITEEIFSLSEQQK